MRILRRGDLLDRAFVVGIVLKGLDGVLEVVGGLLLLAVTPATIDRLTRALTQHELSEDPHDSLASLPDPHPAPARPRGAGATHSASSSWWRAWGEKPGPVLPRLSSRRAVAD